MSKINHDLAVIANAVKMNTLLTTDEANSCTKTLNGLMLVNERLNSEAFGNDREAELAVKLMASKLDIHEDELMAIVDGGVTALTEHLAYAVRISKENPAMD